MLGRAGRPQFDSAGATVVMTQRGAAPRWRATLAGAEAVESALAAALPEFLNAEVALRAVGDVGAAVAWLRGSFLAVRARADPGRYGAPPAARAGGPPLERWLREGLALGTVRELARLGMLRCEDGCALEPLPAGAVMAEMYVRLPTMAAIVGVPAGAGAPELLWAIARSAELSGVVLRRAEKRPLAEANRHAALRHRVMAPARPDRVAARLASGPDKVFVLLNWALSDAGAEIKLDYALRADAEQAATVGARLAAAMVKYYVLAGRAAEAFNALLLRKSLRARLWTGSPLEARQAAGVGAASAERLAAAGVRGLAALAAADPRRLEALARRPYPWGSQVRAAAAALLPPPLRLECEAVGWAPGGRLDIVVTLTRLDGDGAGAGAAAGGAGSTERCPARLFVGSLHDNALLACQPLCLRAFASPLTLRLRTRAGAPGAEAAARRPGAPPPPLRLVASVVLERVVGADLAVRTIVPRSATLGGAAPPPAAAAVEPAEALAEAPAEAPAEAATALTPQAPQQDAAAPAKAKPKVATAPKPPRAKRVPALADASGWMARKVGAATAAPPPPPGAAATPARALPRPALTAAAARSPPRPPAPPAPATGAFARFAFGQEGVPPPPAAPAPPPASPPAPAPPRGQPAAKRPRAKAPSLAWLSAKYAAPAAAPAPAPGPAPAAAPAAAAAASVDLSEALSFI
jgi:ATP-dependent DNA helicase HFM1/MER3